MGKHTFRIDDKDPLYKKLIKLPTTYYKLENNKDGYTVYSHNDVTSKVTDLHNIGLRWENNKIVLKTKDKDGGKKDYVIEQEAIMDKNRNDTINKLQTQGTIQTAIEEFKSIPEDSKNYCITLYSSGREITGVLNFIDFNNENDPVLQKIKKETGGLYFTIEDDNIYISDKDGKCLPVCEDGSCYQYQYTKNECDTLQIPEILTVIKSLTNAEQKFTLQKGKELPDGTYEANIVLNDKTVATLPKIGYYMFNDQLVMRNHVTKDEVVIPRDFHYLKVIKYGNYKLTFCNFLGNEFFEYKRYDPQYSNISDEYKYISLNCMKKEYNPDLCGLFCHPPPFFITKGAAEPNSPGNYQAEVTSNGKKMATLIDEFGFFNEEGEFRYRDYHTETEYGVYDPSKINKKYAVTDTNSGFYLTENDNIILHTSSELF